MDMSGLSPLPEWKAASPDVSRLSLLQPLVLFYCSSRLLQRGRQKRESGSLLLIGRNLWVGGEELQTDCTSPCPASWSGQSFINHVLRPLWGAEGKSGGQPLRDSPTTISIRTKALLLAFPYTRILSKMSFGRKKIPLLKEKRKKTQFENDCRR